jgi:hypothetical protein
VQGDLIYADYSFHCDGPITVDQTHETIGAANVDVLLKVTCEGMGIYVYPGTTFNLRSALVAGNYLFSPPNYSDCSGTLNMYGVNMFWVTTGCTINPVSGSAANLNALTSVGALQYNGGPTLTHALLPGSNAIDGSAPVTGCQDAVGNPLATDQRGFSRVVGVRCDIGAFELGLATLDVDKSISASKYDALTDGLLILRYLFGLRGNALIAGALGPLPTRSSATDIETYIHALMP